MNFETLEFKRADLPILKFEKTGAHFIGKFIKKTKRPYVEKEKKGDKYVPVMVTDPETGELVESAKMIDQLHFEDKDGVEFAVFQDGGLKNALNNADLQEGDIVKIIYQGKIQLKNGNNCNQYEVYKATRPVDKVTKKQ